VAYLVTYRGGDSLYTLDLSDPARPRIRGTLELSGYVSYLQSLSGAGLIGIGQQTDRANGRVRGLQVSFLDVSDLSKPTRATTIATDFGISGVETDPHTFLLWPATGLVVVPEASYDGNHNIVGAMILRTTGTGLTQVHFLQHPDASNEFARPIERSLVIGGTLWTLSDTGLMASSLNDFTRIAWLPFE
jgi:hypothetical protein